MEAISAIDVIDVNIDNQRYNSNVIWTDRRLIAD